VGFLYGYPKSVAQQTVPEDAGSSPEKVDTLS